LHLDFYEQVHISSASSNYWYNFRLNSIYDPDYAVGGNQPYFYTQLSGLYQYYKVIAAEVQVENNNNSSSTDTFISMCPSVFLPITSGDIVLAADHPLSVSTFSTRSPGNKQYSKVRMRKLMMANLFNQSIVEDNYGAVFSQNPLNQAFLNICYKNPVVSSGSMDVYSVVRIRYFVHCYGLVNVAAS